MTVLRRIGQPLPLLRLLVGFILIFPLITATAGGSLLWRNTRAEAERDLRRRTEVAVQSTARIFETNQVILQEMDRMVRGLSDADIQARESELHPRLAEIARGIPHIRDLQIRALDGTRLVSARAFPVERVPRPEASSAMALNDDQSRLEVSDLIVRDDGPNRFFNMFSPRTGVPSGNTGTVVVSILPSVLEAQWAALDIASAANETAMALTRGDGVVLARAPAVPGAPTTDKKLFVRGSDPGGFSGGFSGVSRLDGLERDFRFQRIGGAPLFAVASISERSIGRAFYHTILPHLWFGIPASILLVGLGVLVLRRTVIAEEAMRLAAIEQATRIESERILAKAAKLEALGQLAAGVAHDFNNILAAVIGNAELLRRRIRASRSQEAEVLAGTVLEAAQRGADLTKGILLFARGSDAPGEMIQVADVIAGMLSFLPPLLGPHISVRPIVDDGVWSVRVPKPQLEAALVNLAVNARDAMPDGGTITVRAENIAARNPRLPPELRQDADWVRVAVMDTGPGFPASVRARVFEPFMTTKEVGRGTGLGLAQVYSTARQAGGLARIEDRPEGGAVVALYLPRADAMAHSPDTPFEGARSSERPKRILLVDDDRLVQITSAIGLREAGYDVIEADHPSRGLDALRADPGIEVLVVDYAMPGMDGAAMIAEARKLRPDLALVIVSGQSGLDGVELPPGVVGLLKPFLPDDLMRAIVTANAAGR